MRTQYGLLHPMIQTLNLWKSIGKTLTIMVNVELQSVKSIFKKASKLFLVLLVPSMLGMALLISCDKDDNDDSNCNCSRNASCAGKCKNCTCNKASQGKSIQVCLHTKCA